MTSRAKQKRRGGCLAYAVVFVLGMPVAVVLGLIFVVLSFSLMSGSLSKPVIEDLNVQNTTAVEMARIAKVVSRERGLEWYRLAAYLRVRYNNHLPIPTREQLANSDDPPPDVKSMVEGVWYERAMQWLRGHLDDIRDNLEGELSGDQVELMNNIADVMLIEEEFRRESDGGAAWEAMTEGESYMPVLALTEWRYLVPVSGAKWGNDWGFDRPQNTGYTSTRHHGTDLFAARGTPIRSAGDGVVVNKGWNYLGGRTITIQDEPSGVEFYYAHMQRYEPSISEGSVVRKGDIIGYVGTSGEGPEGTDNVIQDPHLHLGIYTSEGVTNPYPYLQHWKEEMAH